MRLKNKNNNKMHVSLHAARVYKFENMYFGTYIIFYIIKKYKIRFRLDGITVRNRQSENGNLPLNLKKKRRGNNHWGWKRTNLSELLISRHQRAGPNM